MREDLSRQLCALITDGTYKPGDRIAERDCGASRQPPRSGKRCASSRPRAARHLSQSRRVVRKLSSDTVLNLWEAQALEAVAAERFARHGSPEQAERLDDSIRQMDAAPAPATARRSSWPRARFSKRWPRARKMRCLRYIRQINVRLSFLWSSSLMVAGRPAESIKEMRALLVAIRNRNPKRRVPPSFSTTSMQKPSRCTP
jgi:DNA-binding GntR family transcriptional regulator